MAILLYYGHSKEKKIKMKVYSLLGFIDYGGQALLGVFGSIEDLMKFVEVKRSKISYRSKQLGFDNLGYVESELGQEIDVLGEVEYLY